MQPIPSQLFNAEALSLQEAESLFKHLALNRFSELQIAAILTALKVKGETQNEIAAAARVYLEYAEPFNSPFSQFADCCGTGGDGASTFNISTAVAIVVATAGLPIAKHGNRSVSSKCGSADVLEALGLNLDLKPTQVEQLFSQHACCFMFTQRFHSLIKNLAPIRKELSVRTIFNLLGPLLNPARPPIQLVGVYDPELCEVIAQTLALMGCKEAMVVHGSGLDEIAVHGTTRIARLHDKEVKVYEITPSDIGVDVIDLDDLAGGNITENAQILKSVLQGHGSYGQNAAVAINAGALLWMAEMYSSHQEATQACLDLIKTGKPWEKLQGMIKTSQEMGG